MSAETNPKFPVTPGPDPHGQAAMLLAESLIHSLIGNEVLSVQEAFNTVEIARDTQVELADAGRSPQAATELLDVMLGSLEGDLAASQRQA